MGAQFLEETSQNSLKVEDFLAGLRFECIIRRMSHTESGTSRTPNPEHVAH
jgi:hypothetical protein